MITTYQKKLLYILILSSIIILALSLRIYKLDVESLWLDEGISVYQAEKNISKLIEDLKTNVHPPIYYIVLHYWIKLFGNEEFTIRFLSVVFGILSIYVIYRLGTLIFNQETGIISAFLLSISLFHIRYSQEVRFYTLLTLLVLLSNYYLIKIIKEDLKLSIRFDKNIIGYVLSTVAILYTHNFGIFYIIFQNTYYLLIYRKNIRSWITIQGIVLLLFIPWISILMNQINHNISRVSQKYQSIYDTFVNFSGNELNLYIFGLLILTIYIYNIFKNYNNRNKLKKDLFIAFWLFIPILTSFIMSSIYWQVYRDRYVIGSMPALLLLFSGSIYHIKKNDIKKKDIIILVIIVIFSISSFSSIEEYYQTNKKEAWRDVTDYIKHNKGDNEIVLLYPTVMLQIFEYYYKDRYYVINNHKDIYKMDKKYDRVWLITSHIWSGRKKELGLIEKELSEKYIKKETINFPGMFIIDATIYVKKNG